MRRILGIFLLMFLISSPLVSAEEHSNFTAVLKDHVAEGRVDYPALCRDSRFKDYLNQLTNTAPEDLRSQSSQLAFWINVYNAYTLKLICDNYPVKSINDLSFGGLKIGTVLGKTAWDRRIVKGKNQILTLNQVEHKIIRPVFKDPRTHFALVCASRGCPALRSEAYEADRLNEQLDDQARTFLATPKKNSFDLKTKTASISTIFSWFKKDFGTTPSKVLLFLAPFLKKDVADSIRSNTSAWKIRYTDYDWSLNAK